MPEWLAKGIVSIEQKIGKIKNEISTQDKKRKKKGGVNTNEDHSQLLEKLNMHKAKWQDLSDMTIDPEFMELNRENFDCVMESVTL